MDTQLVYVTDPLENNWFYSKYFVSGGNARYWTFQVALNLLHQRFDKPIILETGCQREPNDIGAGMSTSIFAEYIHRYGGTLVTVDNRSDHLERAQGFVSVFPEINAHFILSDSVDFLKKYNDRCDLLYLDSLDYPIVPNKIEEDAAQLHNLNEFCAIEPVLSDKVLVLLDDNLMPGGGKPRLLKEYLLSRDWLCVLDYQQSLWTRKF
jgi:hypothetical protein